MRDGWSEPIPQAVNWIYQAAIDARGRISSHVLDTSVLSSAWLTGVTTASHVSLKLESEQVTGSFKARGAVNKVFSMTTEELERGPLITSSTGNHAIAFQYACGQKAKESSSQKLPHTPVIVLPANVSKYKLDRIRSNEKEQKLQFELILHETTDVNDSESEAARIAEAKNGFYISPYNDREIIGGQGTIALDLIEQLSRSQVDVVFVPVGGGGLISGIAGVIKSLDLSIQVVGCQPANSDVMSQSVIAGKVVHKPSLPTLSDATAGGVDEGSLTLDPCIRFVDLWVTVEETEIEAAMQGVLENDKIVIEGAAGCAVAAAIKSRDRFQGKSLVIIICGKNKAQDVNVD